ncbi:unnamed protein product [Toxocara canis]|uniref:SpoU_methylase domain-containing protein n=1 Tax=Toxocara canis TaxID=6265 RepID=A0A183V0F4_TOXCA|nr:unnamed protein product [Toxocara canis]
MVPSVKRRNRGSFWAVQSRPISDWVSATWQFLLPLWLSVLKSHSKYRRTLISLLLADLSLTRLCRTSEIFGAEKLIVADAGVVNDQNFKALSLSSENWITIEQVRVTELLDYLKSKRKEGYTIVAAEQTTNSVPFASFRFPPKSVILLGDEKEGVPVEYIRCVDESVEIAQVGQTRSLNVHVTGALFIHKYAENNYLTS